MNCPRITERCHHCEHPIVAVVLVQFEPNTGFTDGFAGNGLRVALCGVHLAQAMPLLFAPQKRICGVQRADGAPCTLQPEHLGIPHSYCGEPFEQENRGR